MASQPTPSPPATEALHLVLRPTDMDPGLRPEYAIDTFPATVGRHSTSNIKLAFDSISRYHARIEIHEGRPRVIDLKSSNGTFVNGQRVQVAPLMDQDTVGFGSIEFYVSFEDSAVCRLDDEEQIDETSIQFMHQDDGEKTILHAELPDDTTRMRRLEQEITNQAQLKQARQHLITLYRLQEACRRQSNEKDLLESVLGLLFEIMSVDRGVFLLRDEEDAALFRPLAIRSKFKGRDKIGISRTILQRCLSERVALLSRDAAMDDRFNESDSIRQGKISSVICVPLIGGDTVLGFLHLDTTDTVRSFNEEDLTFLASVGTEVALYLQNLKMVQEKIRSERMAAIGQTITGMAHNIKNILVLSQGGIEMMEKRLHQRRYESLEETWELVSKGIGRINTMVQQMLDFSRARTVEKTRVDPNQFIRDLVATFSEEMTQRGIICDLDLESECPELMLDVDGLDKALCNLILNAIEAVEGLDRPGILTLRTQLDSRGMLTITVGDNGEGIPEEVRPRIFVPFFTTKGSKGSGLGLAMTKKFIEDMGGRLEVKSTVGEGTSFIISLQVSRPESSAGATRT